jgi:phosphoribosylformimino-5-aminoimidazole carboxamide ribotide isomerase
VELYPAIDLIEGAAVRLVQGDFGRRRVYGDPLELARRYTGAGATWIHVVDLEAARSGSPVNRDLVLEIARSSGARIQAGGGVRSEEDATFFLTRGVERVVLGTVAQASPDVAEELAGRYPGRIAIGLDHLGSGAHVAVSGWELSDGTTLHQALDRVGHLELGAVVVTAIERDGTLEGPDLDGLRDVLGWTSHPVIASGGVRSTTDLVDLAALDVDGRSLSGTIVGTALAEGTLGVEEAIAACGLSD